MFSVRGEGDGEGGREGDGKGEGERRRKRSGSSLLPRLLGVEVGVESVINMLISSQL